MEAFHGFAASGDGLKRGVELREIAYLDHNVELSKAGRAKAELAAGEPPCVDESALLQVSHVQGELFAEHDVAGSRLQVAPDVIDIHIGTLGSMDVAVASGRA